MPKNALIILGAGASRGLAVDGQNPNDDYEPPITKEIFTSCKATNGVLVHYEKAGQLAGTLRNRLRTDGDSLELEMSELRDNPQTARAFLEMPLFFQELFGEISAKYSTSNGNYDDLVNTLLGSDIEKVAFVTLNYDLFLDRALARAADIRDGTFQNMSSYTANERWMLVKLHGSVSWMRPILTPGDGAGRSTDSKRRRLLTLLDESPGIRFSDEAEPRVTAWDDWFTKTPTGAQPHYPHLAVPVDDKADPLCPQQHLKALHEFLPTCRNVLAIGVSANDLDLFEQMAGLPDCANFYVVGKTESEATAATNEIEPTTEANRIANRFMRGVPQLQNGWLSTNAFDGGFLDFLSIDRGLESFIAHARD